MRGKTMETLFAGYVSSLILIIVISLLLIVKQQRSIEVVLVWLRQKRKR